MHPSSSGAWKSRRYLNWTRVHLFLVHLPASKIPAHLRFAHQFPCLQSHHLQQWHKFRTQPISAFEHWESHGTGTSMTQGLGCHRGDSDPPPRHLVNDRMQYKSFISNRNCIFTWFTSCCYVRLMLYETYNNVFFLCKFDFSEDFPNLLPSCITTSHKQCIIISCSKWSISPTILDRTLCPPRISKRNNPFYRNIKRFKYTVRLCCKQKLRQVVQYWNYYVTTYSVSANNNV